jgi:hypothetical protein
MIGNGSDYTELIGDEHVETPPGFCNEVQYYTTIYDCAVGGDADERAFATEASYLRDGRGYGARPPHPNWPGNARVAIPITLNYEGGGERAILDGDTTSESMLTDIGFPEVEARAACLSSPRLNMAAGAGACTCSASYVSASFASAFFAWQPHSPGNPEVAQAVAGAWIDYQHVPEAIERDHIVLARDTITKLIGQRPVGWMTDRPSPNTRRLLVEEGGFLYDRDALNDELPYWVTVVNGAKPHLVIPYSHETNDNRFDENWALTSDDYVRYMSDTSEMCSMPKALTSRR